MPFVRISLLKELPLDSKEKVSHAIHESLIQEFNIPENDYFHIIEELEAHQLKYPSSYLGISHSRSMVFVQIIAGAGRTVQQKERLYAGIAERISAGTSIRKEDIIIVLVENSVDNWSFGLGELQKFTHLKQETGANK